MCHIEFPKLNIITPTPSLSGKATYWAFTLLIWKSISILSFLKKKRTALAYQNCEKMPNCLWHLQELDNHTELKAKCCFSISNRDFHSLLHVWLFMCSLYTLATFFFSSNVIFNPLYMGIIKSSIWYSFDI